MGAFVSLLQCGRRASRWTLSAGMASASPSGGTATASPTVKMVPTRALKCAVSGGSASLLVCLFVCFLFVG